MTDLWAAPAATHPVNATVELPGSKSMTNRALVLAALADGPSVLHDALMARDTRLMIEALTGLGTQVRVAPDRIDVDPHELRGPCTIDGGLAGTVLRFLPPVAALATGDVRFTGDAQAAARPLAPLLDGLRQVGVSVTGEHLPFTVHGRGGIRGGTVTVDASASSQFVSGLLLSAARAAEGLTVRHRGGPLPSMPHIEMTVEMLRAVGVAVDCGDRQWTVRPGSISGHTWRIEPDLSNAGPFLAAAMVTGGTVRVPHWPAATNQAGDAWRPILSDLGAAITMDGDGLTLVGTGSWPGFTLDLRDIGELTPTMAALAALADGPSRLTGIGHLRGHETDRLHAIATELTKIGVAVTELDDGLAIDPSRRAGAADVVLDSYADHRLATMAAILALAVPGVRVADPATTGKTMPGFVQMWEALVA